MLDGMEIAEAKERTAMVLPSNFRRLRRSVKDKRQESSRRRNEHRKDNDLQYLWQEKTSDRNDAFRL